MGWLKRIGGRGEAQKQQSQKSLAVCVQNVAVVNDVRILSRRCLSRSNASAAAPQPGGPHAVRMQPLCIGRPATHQLLQAFGWAQPHRCKAHAKRRQLLIVDIVQDKAASL